MGSSWSSVPPEELIQCQQLESVLADAWTKSNDLKLRCMEERVSLRWVNEKRRAVCTNALDLELIMAEQALSTRLATIHHIICAEREEIVKIIEFKSTWFQTTTSRSFIPLQPTHLRNKMILHFVSQYSSYGHGLRGCWADEQMEWIETISSWSVDELKYQVKDSEEEWNEDTLKFRDLFSRFIGLAF